MTEVNVKENENVAEGGELRGGYAEDTQVAGNLDQADFNDLMTRQLVQNNVTLQHQVQQAHFENYQRMANATQMFILGMMGKSEVSYPKSVVEDVVSESVSKTVNDDTSEDFSSSTSKDTLGNMVDNFSKTVQSFEKAIAQQASQQAAQQSQITSALEALLAKIETEVE